MAQALYELLERNGFGATKFTGEPYDLLRTQADFDNLAFIMEGISEVLPYATKPASTPFDFVTNSTLAGGTFPCSNWRCRLDQVETMGQFAALYAEKILVPPPFDDFLEANDTITLDSNNAESILCSIEILHKIRPLIEGRYVEFINTKHNILCVDCYSKSIGRTKTDFKKYVHDIRNYIGERFISEVDISIESSSDSAFANITGPEDLLEHGGFISHLSDESLRRITKRNVDHPVKLNQKNKYFKGICNHFSSIVLDDILRHDYYSKQLGANYLTDRELDVKIIENVGDLEQRKVNSILTQAFAHVMPTIENTDISSLLRLRENENDSFQVYRDSLAETFRVASKDDPAKASQAFRDLVLPEIHRIELTVNNSKRILRRSITDDVVIGTSFVSLGLFGGFLPPNIAAVISALGGAHFAKKLYKEFSSLIAGSEEIRNERFYFLWKARTLGHHKRTH